MDQAFLFERTIDIDTYDRHRDKPREELTLTQVERHSSELEEMDVEGMLAFAERTTLPVFNYLNPISDDKKELVDLTGIEPVTS